MRKLDTKDIYLILFGLFFGLAASEVVMMYIPAVILFGFTIPTGILSFVTFILLTAFAFLIGVGYRKAIAKIASDVKKHLDM
ncbi:hypothetical protein J7J00_24700 [Bacillus sp. ISL-4]|uniref:hypothetical protein n=1 Tax=Bacillus sp. ISL-4 TaxID=2819125 RepID=UPI001BEC2BF6|nr:hypothetical protein [Bacillus sp. ISL-4]MBT2668633.1 hypothetical protein [Bacillus sp. ISL-4]MBT2673393.1 hypothetical protein [Streptomyces sp. ISL-14]